MLFWIAFVIEFIKSACKRHAGVYIHINTASQGCLVVYNASNQDKLCEKFNFKVGGVVWRSTMFFLNTLIN